MTIKLLAFGIARDILGGSEREVELEGVNSIAQLKNFLCDNYAEFSQLKSFSMAVNEEYRDDDFIISHGDEVVVIPPVSGG